MRGLQETHLFKLKVLFRMTLLSGFGNLASELQAKQKFDLCLRY